jgi:glycosyltransferase involved in cell wall biosynthesis
MALLSVIIPCYNESATLGAVLRAVRATGHDMEVVVVDDASTDGTGDLIRGELAPLIDVAVSQNHNRG